MSVFKDIEIGWKGQTYIIPSNQVLGAIARIEDYLTLPEIASLAETGATPMGKLSQAYASVLQYAGCRVTPEEVYEGMFEGDSSDKLIMDALSGLLSMMIPPNAEEIAEEGEDTKNS